MTQKCWLSQCWQIGFVGLVGWLGTFGAVVLQTLVSTDSAFAQSNIVQDSTLGAESSQVVPNYEGKRVEAIFSGAIRGVNLFHSFQEFNVSNGRGAYFFSPNVDIQNILARVTGSNRSEILGTLGTFGESQPNLFLINPNGIVFGANASLDVGGSFVAATANAVKLGEIGFFSATEPASSNLLSVNPSALFYNAVVNQGEIVNRSRTRTTVPGTTIDNSSNRPIYGLNVLDGKSLLLVGGDVRLERGFLEAPGGSIELGGLAEPGTVGLSANNGVLSLNFPENIARADVSITDAARLSVLAGNGGSIVIDAANINISGNSRLFAGIDVGKGSANSQAGDITLNATGAIKIDESSLIINDVNRNATGNSGNINVIANSVSLTDEAQLSASTYGRGNAGSVKVNATDFVSLAGNSYILSTVEASGVGNGGNIDINAASLILRDGAQLLTLVRQGNANNNRPAGRGDAGNVNVNVTGAVTIAGQKDGFRSGISSEVIRGGIGNGGNITISSSSFSLTNGAEIAASTFGQGNAGSVKVTALDTVSLTDNAYIESNVERTGVGNGGNIDINAASVSLKDGAYLDASTYGQGNGGNIFLRARDAVSLAEAYIESVVGRTGVGKGGNIDINAGSVSLKDGAYLITSTSGKGNAGNVNASVTGAVTIDGGENGLISGIGSGVQAGAIGNGGNITIFSGSLSFNNVTTLSTSTDGQGNAGNVIINARDRVSWNGTSPDGQTVSAILSSVGQTGKGNGGDIRIATREFFLRDGAQLSTSTYGQGNAGSVIIDASDLVSLNSTSPDGRTVSAVFSTVGQTGKGNSGDIRIATREFFLRGGAALNASTDGQGDAGNVIINASDRVSLSGASPDGQYVSGIFSSVGQTGKGNSGDIYITTQEFSLQDSATLNASTFGQGNAGDVIIDASDRVSLSGASPDGQYVSGVFSRVEPTGVGNSGDIYVTTGKLTIQGGARLSANTVGQGNAGDVIINASDRVSLSGTSPDGKYTSAVFSNIGQTGKGNGGDIRINTRELFLQGGSELVASTYGQGNAGNIFLQASDSVSLASRANIFTSVEASGVGNAGNIDINTATFSLKEGASLVTVVREASDTQPAGRGNAGNVNIDVTGAMTLAGSQNGFLSGIFSRTGVGTEGKGGNIKITTDSLSILDGATLSATTLGKGDAGNVIIDACGTVSLSGSTPDGRWQGGVFARTESQGRGGNIDMTAEALSITNGAQIAVSSDGQGDAGNIRFRGNQLEATDGGQILTTTSGSGRAGKITVNATKQITVSGRDATFNERIAKFPEENFPNVGANSGFFALSFGSSIAGDIEVNSPKVTLDNSGRFIANSASGNGGNINLNVSDLLLLRRGAQIATNAGTSQKGGDGGNINVNSKYIVAVPEEDSDISANAYTGTGGQVQINSQGIFGIEARTRPTERSDITASSELGIAGVTNINSPDTSSLRNSLNQLPENIIDTNALIANSCIARRNNRQSGTFLITGGGGLPERPGDAPLSPYLTGAIRSVPTSENSATPTTSGNSWKLGDPIVEPQGAYQLANGKLVLSRECPQGNP